MTTATGRERGRQDSSKVRSIPFHQWPHADQSAWAVACRPAVRLTRGGSAAHFKEITRRDLMRRYGYFLDHVQRTEGLDLNSGAAALVTPERVARFVAELQGRVSSVTAYGSIYKLRRMAQLLALDRDFGWLIDIERDLECVMQPRSKFDRFVETNCLIDAGIRTMREADAARHRSPLGQARQFRNGLMVAMLASHPIRLKNFAQLEIARTIKQTNGSWWIVLAATETKEKRVDERIVDKDLIRWIERYVHVHRPVLAKGSVSQSLWVSSNSGRPMTYNAIERVITDTAQARLGRKISPHLFRTSGSSTVAVHAGDMPDLGPALMHHRGRLSNQKHYNRAKSLNATRKYALLIATLRNSDLGTNDLAPR